MPSSLQKAIIKTLVYADLFDYPLTSREIMKRLIKFHVPFYLILPCRQTGGGQAVGCRRGDKVAIQNSKLIEKTGDFYHLKDRKQIIDIRRRREASSKKKLEIAKKVAFLLHFVSTVKLIGVTGALAVENAKEKDDIDFFIVANKNLLWTTRLLVTILVELVGKRRRPGDKYIKNKICLNMFVDEDHLAVSKEERNLFTAYEVIQMKPLYDKDNTYNKFLIENLWIKDYLPNSMSVRYKKKDVVIRLFGHNTGRPRTLSPRMNEHSSSFWYWVRSLTFHFIEKPLKSFQLWYMRRRRTTEAIKDGIIRFHPQDAKEWILKNYKAKLESYVR